MNSISAYKSSISRMPATVIVAAGLAFGLTANAAQARDAGQTCYFGECLPRASTPAVAKAAPSDESFRVIATQGGWSVARNGQAVIVSREFDGGAKFAIIRTKDGYGLAFVDPSWKLREGQTFKFSIDIDGKTYSAHGKAASSTMMVAADIRDEFMDDFANGELVKFEIAGSKWTIVPANANAVLKAATNS
jgi:hypothetical protein